MIDAGQVNQLVLLTTQRSGSTFVRLWLDSHPHVRCHSEIFFREYPAADGFKAYCEASIIRNALYRTVGNRKYSRSSRNLPVRWLIERFLYALYHDPSFSAPWTDMTTNAWQEYKPRSDANPEKVVGFQLMYDQLRDYDALQGWLARHEVTIIHLVRENALKLLVSRTVAKQTGQFHFARTAQRPQIPLDPQKTLVELQKIVAKRESMRQQFKGHPYLEITYEKFFAGDAHEQERILHFLGLKNAAMQAPGFLEKLNPDSVRQVIENYDEIAAALRDTPYAEFCDAP
jgi:LPS sulfotransferase NodH